MSKVPAVTLEKIAGAVKFLKRWTEFAELEQNREWTKRLENALSLIRGVAVCE